MDKLEHFLKKNHHRIVHYFTTMTDQLVYVMVLSVHDGVLYLIDLKDGNIPFVEAGSFQKRFYVGSACSQSLPEPVHEQPTDRMMRDEKLWKGALRVLRRKQADGSLVVMGSNYLIDARPDGSFLVSELIDFPDTMEQQGIFQKYDLDYFYNHKHTISQNVRLVYDKFHAHFLENLEAVKGRWEQFSRDPSRHLSGLEALLRQYDERNKQCGDLKNLVLNMYQIWKQLSSEHDAMDAQVDPISFDQNLKMNQKRQLLYRKLDKIKLIEKHATDLLLKIHIAKMCLLFCTHLIVCEMGDIQFRLDDMVDTQSKIQKHVLRSPAVMIFQE